MAPPRVGSITGLALVAILLTGFASAIPAFANPYNAGYITGTPTAKISFQFRSDILQADSGRESSISSLLSAAGFASSGATTPTGWSHQIAARLNTDNTMSGKYNIYNTAGTCVSGCGIQTSLGSHGTGPNNVNYIYMNIWHAGPGSSLLFLYWEKVENDGDVIPVGPTSVNLATLGDPSRMYKIGTQSQSINSPCTGTKTFKFFQFGVESTVPVTKNWKIKQYDLQAAGTSLSTNTAKSGTGGSCSSSLVSWITYVINGGTTSGARIGPDVYPNVNAKYNQIDPTVPDGQIHWYKDSTSTTISNGVTLWP